MNSVVRWRCAGKLPASDPNQDPCRTRGGDFAAINATVVSSIRLLNPHSLWCPPAFGLHFDSVEVSGRRNERGMAGRYFADISATVVSSMRFEKPHSLSYQAVTLTRRPATLVSVASKMLERGSWLKSLETSGPVL